MLWSLNPGQPIGIDSLPISVHRANQENNLYHQCRGEISSSNQEGHQNQGRFTFRHGPDEAGLFGN